MKRQIISVMIIILVLFNFIFCNRAYAKEADKSKTVLEKVYTETNSVVPSPTAEPEIYEKGEVSSQQGSATKVSLSHTSAGSAIVGTITGVISRIINVLVFQIDIIMSQLTFSTENSDELYYWFSIERCVFNRVPLFNINYLNTQDTYKVGDTEITANSSNIEVKNSVANVYYICRFIAMALGLLVLIYIGIRMAISTVASEQARYKKMLVSWVESFVIIFLMLYIISAVITFGEVVTNSFYRLEQNILANNSNNPDISETFEKTVRTQLVNNMLNMSGLQLTFWSIMYWALLFMEAKFFWTYIKRFFMVGFLIIISPLITITYSIDKAGDGTAQAFSNWMKEFITNVLIQPLHAAIYMIFVLTANNIAAKSPIIAIAFLLMMGTVEKLVKQVFNINQLSTLQGIGEVKLLGKKGK